MVLSNKKLKQKLRADAAESLASTQPNPNPNPNPPQSLKLLLDSATQRPRLSKREKRRENQPSLASETETRKRKTRDEKDETLIENHESDQKKKNPKKKKKKKRKNEVKKENGEKMAVDTNEEIENSEAIGNGVLKVYVGGIPYYSTEDDIRSYFEGCGTVTEVDCMTFPESGKFRGIAIITFKTEAAAKRALALNGSDMGGLFLTVQPFKANRANKSSDFAPEVVEGYNRIYVGNLSWDITEEKLRNFFSDCKISSVRFGTDKDSGEFRGYAHVDFSDGLSFTMALKLNQKVVCGRPAKISCAVPLRKEPTNKAKTNHDSSMATEIVNPTSLVGSTEISNTDTGLSSVGTGKMRKRTCYECGEKGHTSSDCPNKAVGPTTVTTTTEIINPTSLLGSNETGNTDTRFSSVVSGKIKRRTCYECGEKGHLSSDCPKKAVGSTTVTATTEIINPTSLLGSNETGNTDTMLSSVVSGKIKRRTCYECGEKGHLSSDCPKKGVGPTTVTTPIERVVTTTETMTEIVNPTDIGNSSAGLSSVTAGKMRRRTCYECGEKGHISSDCPKITEIQQIPLQNNLH